MSVRIPEEVVDALAKEGMKRRLEEYQKRENVQSSPVVKDTPEVPRRIPEAVVAALATAGMLQRAKDLYKDDKDFEEKIAKHTAQIKRVYFTDTVVC